jgi:hypothetical protein
MRVMGDIARWWPALAVTILTGACGGSTRAESSSSLDASDDLLGVDDGGAPDIAPGEAPDDTPDDVVIPDLDFGSIGKPVLITNQFLFTEGPVWDPSQQVLFFADIDGDTIHRFTPPGAFDIAFASSGHANGLAIDAQGRLLVAGFGARMYGWRDRSCKQPTAIKERG